MPGDLSFHFIRHFLYSQIFGHVPDHKPSFTGKTVIITGSNTGLGFEAARKIARLGVGRLILGVRSISNGEKAKAAIENDTGCGIHVVQVWQLDLQSYASVKYFAEKAIKELDRIDVLLANAGTRMTEWTMAEDNETTLTVNVVSTFLLANMMMPKLRESAARYGIQPTLTFVTSDTHYFVDFEEKNAPEGVLNNMNKARTSMAGRYETSKLLVVFMVRAMAAKHPIDKSLVIINMVNPGMTKSSLMRNEKAPLKFIVPIVQAVVARTPEKGSRVLVHGVSAGPSTHGKYLDMCHVEDPATVVVGPGGVETQKKVYREVMEKLEKIQPGLSSNL